MGHLLNDEKIAKAKANVDREELNAALNLAYYFTKKEICSLSVKDVFDGNDILSSIQFDANKPPKQTEDSLKTILTSHIKHLEQTSSIDLDAPLFPGYFGSSGEKQLQRHIPAFSIYRDFNAVKKDLRVKQYQQAQEGDQNSPVEKIAQSTGKSKRTIGRSVGRDPGWSGSPRGQGMTLKEDDPQRLLQIMDYTVVMPEIYALDEKEVHKTITTYFNIIGRLFKSSEINRMKNILIKNFDNRVSEIEKELLETRNRTPKTVEKSETLVSPLRQLSNYIIVKHNEKNESIQIIHNEQLVAIPDQKKQSSNIDQTAKKNLKILTEEVSDQIITDKLNELLLHVNQVRNMISSEEWDRWKKQQELKELYKLQVSSAKTENKGEEDNYLKNKLHRQRYRSPRITFQSSSPLEIKRKRIKYAKQYIRDNTPDHSVVIKYAVELIKHTGLFCDEVIGLCLKNVIKVEYQNRLIDEGPQSDWIVDEIEPLPMKYPRGCNALSIRLSNEAKEVIRAEIEFLRGIESTYFPFSKRSPLFPLSLSPPRFSRKKPNKGTKPKTSCQQRDINRFKRALQKNHVLGGYERLRKEGISLYCAELIKVGLPIQEMARSVQRFARYSNVKAVNRIIDEIQKQPIL